MKYYSALKLVCIEKKQVVEQFVGEDAIEKAHTCMYVCVCACTRLEHFGKGMKIEQLLWKSNVTEGRL